MNAKQAIAKGYAIISRSGCWAARIDRKDWKEHMASKHPRGMTWVDCLGEDAADHYRRCYSKDVIVVPCGWIKVLPNSRNGPLEYKD